MTQEMTALKTLEDLKPTRYKNNLKPHDWTKDKHPYYKFLAEQGISNTKLYREYGLPQTTVDNVVNFKSCVLKTLLEMKLVAPEFNLLDYIEQFFLENKFKNENLLSDEELVDYRELKNELFMNDIVEYLKLHKDAPVTPEDVKNLETKTLENKRLSKQKTIVELRRNAIQEENQQLSTENLALKEKIAKLENNEALENENTELKKKIAELEMALEDAKSRKYNSEVDGKIVCENLVKELETSGMSQRAFSEYVGIPRTTLKRYLSGQSTPPVEKIEELNKLFGKDLTKEMANE